MNTTYIRQFPLKMPHSRNLPNSETQIPRYKFRLNQILNLNLCSARVLKYYRGRHCAICAYVFVHTHRAHTHTAAKTLGVNVLQKYLKYDRQWNCSLCAYICVHTHDHTHTNKYSAKNVGCGIGARVFEVRLGNKIVQDARIQVFFHFHRRCGKFVIMYVYVYIYTCIHIHIFMYIYVYVYICVYIQMYICIYAYIYINTHIHMYILYTYI